MQNEGKMDSEFDKDVQFQKSYEKFEDMITSFEHLENALPAKNDWLKIILKYAGDGINIAKIDRKTNKRTLVLCNDKYVKMSGRSREELVAADDLGDFITHSEEKDAHIRWLKALRNGESCTGRASWIRPDGRENFYEWTATPITIDEDIYVVGVDRDVTQQQRMDKALFESQGRLKKAQQIAHIGSWEWNVKDNTFFMSEEMRRIYGISNGDHFQNIESVIETSVHPDDKELVKKAVAEVLAGLKTPLLSFRIVQPEGSIRWVSAFAPEVKHSGSDGELETITGTIQDITENKATADALARSEAIYRQSIENAQGVPFQMRMSDGKFLFIGSAIEDLIGVKAEDVDRRLLRKMIEDTVPIGPDVPEDYVEYHRAFVNGELERYQADLRLCRPDGEIKWISDRSVPIKDENTGKVIGALGILQDITERKQIEESLRESEQRLRLILEHSFNSININEYDLKTQKRRLILCNDRFVEMSGRSREELMATDDLRPLTVPLESEKVTSRRHKLVEQEKPFNGTSTWIRPDGKELICEWTTAPLLRGDKAYLIGIGVDATERIQQEREREKLLEVLEEKNSELESIIHVTTHDLRTPMVNIIGFSQELKSSCEKILKVFKTQEVPQKLKQELDSVVVEDIPEAIDLICMGVSKIQSLLDSLLRLAKLGHLATKIENLDMNRLVKDIIKTFAFQVKKSNSKITVDKLPGCPGDELQIQQVLTNLIENALKNFDPDRPGSIRISGKKEEGKSVYCIEDNGIGIQEDKLGDIFRMFYRIDSKSNKGEGIGLSIVRRIVHRHNGQVWVESEFGVGSSFFVALPNP